MSEFGIWSLVPPIVAITLAIVTKEIVLSLFAAIVSGSAVYVFVKGGAVIDILKIFVDITTSKFGENMPMVIFLALLGGLVAVITAVGGTKAYGEWAVRRVKSERTVNLMTIIMGLFIFIDDYFNCLSVGAVMRPLADKYKVSRAKLAYFLDATSAPVCILAPVSSWSAYVISCIPEEMQKQGMKMFISAAPLNFYAILSLIMVFWIALKKNSDFGVMSRFEKLSHKRFDIGAVVVMQDGLDSVPEKSKGCVCDLLGPIAILICTSIWLLQKFDSGIALALSSLLSLIYAFITMIPRGAITINQYFAALLFGIKTMVPAIVMLSLAWTISGLCNDLLGTGSYIAELIVDLGTDMRFLPAIMFIVAATFAFTSGASWAAIGILVPIGITVCMKASPEFCVLVLAATLAGSVMGDHCSPIADTTILASTGAGCKHLSHVLTQMPYAIVAGLFSVVGFLLAGLLMPKGYVMTTIVSLIAIIILFISGLCVLSCAFAERKTGIRK